MSSVTGAPVWQKGERAYERFTMEAEGYRILELTPPADNATMLWDLRLQPMTAPLEVEIGWVTVDVSSSERPQYQIVIDCCTDRILGPLISNPNERLYIRRLDPVTIATVVLVNLAYRFQPLEGNLGVKRR